MADLWERPGVSLAALVAMFVALSGITQCSTNCPDGNGGTEPCISCSVSPPVPCKARSWNQPAETMCDPALHPDLPDGTACDFDAVEDGVCISGQCAPRVAAGTGTTRWQANAGGCSAFPTTIGGEIYLDMFVTLTVTSDGSNNLATEWEIDVVNPLLPTAGIAEYAGISIAAAVANATPTSIPSSGGPNVGFTLDQLLAGNTLSLASPGEVTVGQVLATPTAGPGSNVAVNLDTEFEIELTLFGEPFLTIFGLACEFDVQGSDIVFPVVAP